MGGLRRLVRNDVRRRGRMSLHGRVAVVGLGTPGGVETMGAASLQLGVRRLVRNDMRRRGRTSLHGRVAVRSLGTPGGVGGMWASGWGWVGGWKIFVGGMLLGDRGLEGERMGVEGDLTVEFWGLT